MLSKLTILTLLLLIISSSGYSQWIEGGTVVCDEPHDQAIASVVSDNAGGAIIVWVDDRDLYPYGRSKYFAQRINSDGVTLWATNGIAPIDTVNSFISLWSTISDLAGGAIFTWVHTPGFKQDNIYAQRIRYDGQAIWTNDGIPVCTASAQQIKPRCTPDGANGVIITWEDSRNGPQDTYAQRITSAGNAAWATNGVRVSLSADSERAQAITSDGNGGAIIAWQDSRNVDWDIYAQKLNSSGELQWPSSSIPVFVGEGLQLDPILVTDGSNGAIIVWKEDSGNANSDFFAQRIASDGTILWDSLGVPIVDDDFDQGGRRFISDMSGGAFILWEELRNGNVDIYGQRLDSDGNLLWDINGKPLIIHPSNQRYFSAVRDNSDGLIITWVDDRSGISGIYASRIDSNGDPIWDPAGITITDDLGHITYCRVTSDMDGGVLMGFSGNHPGFSTDIFAKRLTPDGDVVPTLLSEYWTNLISKGISIKWSLSAAISIDKFSIYRAHDGNSEYSLLEDIYPNKSLNTYSYIDSSVQPGHTYRYQVVANNAGKLSLLFETASIELPYRQVELGPNYPNPFNPNTSVNFYIPERALVSLDVYRVDGTHVFNVICSHLDEGYHTYNWSGCDRYGNSVASGVYLYRLKVGKSEISRKMVLLK
jgi:hypothetical protein